MNPNLPTVLHVARNHQVSVATVDKQTRISITPASASAYYRKPQDLPFVHRVENGRGEGIPKLIWFYSPKADNWHEAVARGHFYWEEFVRYARGPQKRRRKDAEWLISVAIEALGRYKDCEIESQVFAEHIAEALIAHLRVGLDEGKTDQQLASEG